MPTLPSNYYDRFDAAKEFERILFLSGPVLQSAELNEIQRLLIDRLKLVGDALLGDGHVISGAAVAINNSGVVTAASGVVYANGAARTVAGASFTIPLTGSHQIGIRLYESVVTSTDDPSLLNPVTSGTHYLDPGAARLKSHAYWGWEGDGAAGDFHPCYAVSLGVLQSPNPLVQLYTPGSHTVPVPYGFRWADIELWGAGGGGVKASSANHGEGGGGGGYARRIYPVTAGSSFIVTVGTGGSPVIGSSGSAGNGGDTTVTIGGVTAMAGGGGGANIANPTGGGPGTGGVATGGEVNINGQIGVDGTDYILNNGDYNAIIGFGGASPNGGAGSNMSLQNSISTPGEWPGGGGGGAKWGVGYGADGGAIIKFS